MVALGSAHARVSALFIRSKTVFATGFVSTGRRHSGLTQRGVGKGYHTVVGIKVNTAHISMIAIDSYQYGTVR